MDRINPLRVAIVGATGYTGLELVRLLSRHPRVELAALTSESSAGQHYSELFPQFGGIVNLELIPQARLDATNLDAVFLALPHKASMEFVRGHDLASAPVIDLSADFRLSSAQTYEEWYAVGHACPELLKEAVYGLPELHREEIRSARLVANPGCYPTCTILPLAPLLKSGLISPRGIIVDAKSGVTGAGYKPKATTHYPTVNEGFMAYGLKRHRHVPEIEEQLGREAGGGLTLQFTPHLLPVNRGILATIYAAPGDGTSEERLRQELERAYGDEPFVRVVDEPPSLDSIRGSNFCDIFATVDDRTGNVLIVSVIDNLVKGAAGQALQNLNIMFGFEETTGLAAVPLSP